MESYFQPNTVVFLTMNDFQPNGDFKHDLKGKPMLIMIGGGFCGHCRTTAPAFSQFAVDIKQEATRRLDKKAKAVAAFVAVDDPDQKEVGRFLGSLYKIEGIPTFLLYDANGKKVKIHKERTTQSFHAAVAPYSRRM